MPYALVEDKIAEISPQYREELLAFIDYLLYRQKKSVSGNGESRKASSFIGQRRKGVGRKLGGFEEGFQMSPDFDAPLESFKEYM